MNAMVPIALAALGEIFTEKSGVVNIGLEGTMLVSAILSFFVAVVTQDPYIALFVGVGVGAIIGLGHSAISVYLKGDQIISGVGINVLGLGFAALIYETVTGPGTVLNVYPVRIVTPWGQLRFMVVVCFVIALGLWYLLERTRLGMNVRAVGENPEAADAVGINVERTRLICTVVGACLAGLAGAYLSVDFNLAESKNITQGRGFIALATVVFSGWNPIFGLAGSLLFGLSQGASIWVRLFPAVRDFPFVNVTFQLLPYLATLVAVALLGKRSRMPKALGTPYRRE